MGDITWGDIAVFVLAFTALIAIIVSMWSIISAQRTTNRLIEELKEIGSGLGALQDVLLPPYDPKDDPSRKWGWGKP